MAENEPDLESQQTSRIWPSQASYRMSFVNSSEKIDRIIMALQCLSRCGNNTATENPQMKQQAVSMVGF